MDHNHSTIKHFMAITAERDAAIRERNMALEERKRAFAERDLAMLHRDAAISERNAAIQARDEAIAALRNRENSMNDSITIPDSLGNELANETKNIQYSQQMRMTEASYGQRGGNDLNITEAAYGQRGGNDLNITEAAYGQRGGNNLNITEAAYDPRGGNDLNIREASQPAKQRRGRQPKEGNSTKSAKSPRAGKRTAEAMSKPVNSNGWINERNSESDEDDPEKQVSWKDNLGLNQINFDESAMPVPVCTCTGSPQPCYRWGNGGWQSACCTTTISMYPLPQMANKRYSRIGGRKMSGSAFGKLLNRLAAEGHDFSNPLDLKDHWAKHGTNRYSTLK